MQCMLKLTLTKQKGLGDVARDRSGSRFELCHANGGAPVGVTCSCVPPRAMQDSNTMSENKSLNDNEIPRPASRFSEHIVPQPGQTGMVKDAKGAIHLFKDGKELYVYRHGGTRRPGPGEQRHWTLEDMVKAYERLAAEWRESPCFGELKDFLEEKILPLEHLKLDTCIALGVGEFTVDWMSTLGYPDNTEVSMKQLAVFEATVELLREFHQMGKTTAD